MDKSQCIYSVGDETIEKPTSNTKCVAIVRGLPGVHIYLLLLVSFSLLGSLFWNYERIELKKKVAIVSVVEYGQALFINHGQFRLRNLL